MAKLSVRIRSLACETAVATTGRVGMKKIDRSSHIGDGGIAVIHRRVNQMGFVWHEHKLDAGIDGEIELRDPSTGEVANRLILIQSKASNQRFAGETDRSFHFQCKPADIDYWMAADDPVLLVCSHPQTGEAWWMHIQSWFADPARRASGRIDFDKRTQRFDASAAPRLLNLADPHGFAHVPIAEYRAEELTTNLLRVTVPPLIYGAVCTSTDGRDVLRRQESATDDRVRHDFILREGRLYTWLPPEETPLRTVVQGHTDAVSVKDWSADRDRQRWLVQLLNRALQQDVSKDCAWHGGRKILYFRPSVDLRPRTVRSASERLHQVFKPKFKRQAPDEISYCKHVALEWRFLTLEGEWLCALTPTYHYTRDGVRDSLFLPELLSGIKLLEKNPAVHSKTVMWATYLRGADDVLDPRETILTYGELVTLSANRSIDDAAWLFEPNVPPVQAEAVSQVASSTDDFTLFEVES